MIALQDHIAIGSSRRKMIAWESKTIAERVEKSHHDRLMADPKAPTVEGEGIVVVSHLRDIFVNVKCSFFFSSSSASSSFFFIHSIYTNMF
jgi:hypothetical protein